MATRILLADDDDGLRRVLQFKLQQNGYEVSSAGDGSDALKQIRSANFDLLITDMKMPGLNGIELLTQARALKPNLEVILMTAFAEVSLAVEAMKLGAFDYLQKPFDDEQLFAAIDKALRFKKLEKENRDLRQQLQAQSGPAAIAGVSKQYHDMLAMIEKVAPTDATVLITGESGSGKEVVAKCIHTKSSRADSNFVAINCAAIPKELIESELFGHVKGAFTGAVRDKKGKFELADGGTLLLDEISELSIELQAKLLRAIQERVIEPVGAEQKIDVDIRILAATNKDLKLLVADGRFREDLFYRLNVIPLNVPPLRERREDITVLVKGFLKKYSAPEEIKIDSKLMNVLTSHDWPGNVRELENLIERMVILRSGPTLTVADLPTDFGQVSIVDTDRSERSSGTARVGFHEAEKKLVLDALDKCGWNRSRAAEYLKIPRHVLVYRMKKYELFDQTKA